MSENLTQEQKEKLQSFREELFAENIIKEGDTIGTTDYDLLWVVNLLTYSTIFNSDG